MPSTTAIINAFGPLFDPNLKITPAIQKAAESTRVFGTLLVKSRTPVRTSLLRSQWETRLEANGIRFRNGTYYGLYVEMGTKRMKGRHMLGGALPEIQEHFKTQLAKEIGKSLSAKVLANVDNGVHIQPFQNAGYKPLNTNAFRSLTSQGAFKPTPIGAGKKDTGKTTSKGFNSGLKGTKFKGLEITALKSGGR